MKLVVAHNGFKFSDEQISYFNSVDAKIISDKSDISVLADIDAELAEDYVIAIKPGGFEGGWDSFPLDAIKKLKHLKAVVLGTTSFSWVDYKAFKELGISVSNTPGKSTNAVAEYNMFAMHALLRKYPILVKEGDEAAGLLEEAQGKTAGIIGLGDIGTRTAELCEGHGMKVQYYNRSSKSNNWKAVELEELVKTSDVIFVTIAANPELHGLLPKQMLAGMKQDAYFISIAHHDVYDLEFLQQQVADGNIAGLAYEDDEADLKDFKGNVFVTPEVAYYTTQTLQNEATIVTDTVKSYLEGSPVNVVN